jgi:hypothetical protein
MNRFAVFSIILITICIISYLIVLFFGKGQLSNTLSLDECNQVNKKLNDGECQYFDYNEELCLIGKKNRNNECVPEPNILGRIVIGLSLLSLFGSIIFFIIFLKVKIK